MTPMVGERYCDDHRHRVTPEPTQTNAPSLFDSSPLAGPEKRRRTRAAAPDSFTDHPPSAPGSATSETAAATVGRTGHARALSQRVLVYLHSQAQWGATRAELTAQLDARLSSICATVNMLVKQGRIAVCGTRLDSETHMRVEVLMHEEFVARWTGIPRADRVQKKDGAS